MIATRACSASVALLLFLIDINAARSFAVQPRASSSSVVKTSLTTSNIGGDDGHGDDDDISRLFSEFVGFLKSTQTAIIDSIEEMDGSDAKFTRDAWGSQQHQQVGAAAPAGGVTRVLQGGDVVEKGACSLTIIENGTLTAERAATIQSRQGQEASTISAGDSYSAAALSIVLHSRSPMVPTFRSYVRIFVVESKDSKETLAWFGGGADLTPYYLFDDDISEFHRRYRDLCDAHADAHADICFENMKKACDDYFYLPARSEHRGTGGIFFDDLPATDATMAFVKGVADLWMPSWFPIIERRRSMDYTEQQVHWQRLRRGRYLEFNLLYDRGVKFGLANANPRVEGVMVSAPPLIAWEYNHKIEMGSEEERLMNVLKAPRDWLAATE